MNEQYDDDGICTTNVQLVTGAKAGGSVLLANFDMSYKKAQRILTHYKALLDSAKYTVAKYRKQIPSRDDRDCPVCTEPTPVENCIHIHMLEKSIKQLEG